MFKKRYIQTVVGEIDPEKLGIADAHNHVYIEEIPGSHNVSSLLNDFGLIKEGLLKYKKVGGCSILDSQPWECGRNGNVLYRLSKETGVYIIAVTGFHKREYYPASSEIWSMTEQQAANFFEDEIRMELKETLGEDISIKAGLVKIAYTGNFDKEYLRLINAAVTAAVDTGTSIMVHTDRGMRVELLIDYLESRNFPLSNVMLCHMDKRNDISLHKYLAEKMVYLEYDTFFKLKYEPEKNVWPLILQMVTEGYCERIAIGSDITPGYTLQETDERYGLHVFLQDVMKRMSDFGIPGDAILKMMDKNIKEFLTITENSFNSVSN
jgi:phosphotriesterase-related protein